MQDKVNTPQPCPFCKSIAVVVPEGARVFSVVCDGEGECFFCGPQRATEREAIEAWNLVNVRPPYARAAEYARLILEYTDAREAVKTATTGEARLRLAMAETQLVAAGKQIRAGALRPAEEA